MKILLACAALGAIAVAVTFTVRSRPAVPAIATEEYGERLLAQTSELLGPDQPDPAMRYSGTRLACGSCHLETGLEPGTLSLLPAAAHYPRVSPRTGTSTRRNICIGVRRIDRAALIYTAGMLRTAFIVNRTTGMMPCIAPKAIFADMPSPNSRSTTG